MFSAVLVVVVVYVTECDALIDVTSSFLLIERKSWHYIETNQLICRADQLTGFYMTTTLAFNELNEMLVIFFPWKIF